MSDHTTLGEEGEEEAKQFLQANGYSIIEQNWRHNKYEIDLIALKDSEVIFIEVKTRSTAINNMDEVISPSKEKALINAVNYFMEENNYDLECRIDLILIEKKIPHSNVIHIKNAISQA